MSDNGGKNIGNATPNGKTGAALVVGGGIAGMESALSLADSGYLVRLVTDEPTVGGRMAQLDKTFPTNDCSTCMISPRMVAVGGHPNIDIITMAELESLEGEPGRFTARIRKKARFIDEEKCTGCAECASVCPVKLDDSNNEGLSSRRATYRLFPQAVPNWFAIERDRTAPCKNRCPAHISVQGYVNLVAEGRFKDALEVVRHRNPFPSVCGRVCFHPCEDKCNRGRVDEPVAINRIKRFISDLELEEAGVVMKTSGVDRTADKSKEFYKELNKNIPTRDERVAIIGAGPSGLTAAHDLALQGFKCVVFEKLPVAGGMLAVGIPEYRLPMKVLEYEVKRITDLGVEIRYNSKIDKDKGIDGLFADGFKAVYIAVGSHGSSKLRIKGEELPGVLSGIDFLRKVKLGEATELGKKVAVIGGGNVAMDAARTALRMGAKVTIVYRRSREEMPAHHWEIEEAVREGCELMYLTSPEEIIAGADGKAAKLRCLKNELGEPDDSGRRKPIAVAGSEFDLEVDTVLAAIGQATEIEFLTGNEGIGVERWGTVIADKKTCATSRPGVFSGGDCVTGPAMAIDAIGAGKMAAESIARYINGQSLEGGRYEDGLMKVTDIGKKMVEETRKSPRHTPSMLSMDERRGNFTEVEKAFTAEQAVAEAKRCMNCGPCADCRMCELACQKHAVDFEQKEKIMDLEVGAVVLAPGFKLFNPEQMGEYAYGKAPNVITSLQFERMLSASGPYEGHVKRPSDRKEPKKLAFIQCVGSRNERIGRGYCSSVCCMYATKQAIIGKEHIKDADVTIFYKDLRAFGKGFDRYWQSARDKKGVKYVRAMVSAIKEKKKTGNLTMKYLEGGEFKEQEFDMVVLSCGLEPSPGSQRVAEKLGIKLDKHGFAVTDSTMPVQTSREGVYVCGAFESPKDIPESVVQATGAAGKVMALLGDARWTCTKKREFPPEIEVKPEDEVRAGVFVCHCGTNIAGVVDVKKVVADAVKQPGVVYADNILFTCSQDSQDAIRRVIAEHKLNRVIVSSCSPRTHEPLFRNMLKEAGLNPYLFEMANIRDQCSWVHGSQPENATDKAVGLTRMAIAKGSNLRPLRTFTMDVVKRGLVIGGGLSGMTAAQSLAEQGFEVHLVEREGELGGEARKLRFGMNGSDAKKYLAGVIDKVKANANIKIHLNSVFREISGGVGDFKSIIAAKDGSTAMEVAHGTVVMATGGEEYKPTEYMYGQSDKVMTNRELEQALGDGKIDAAKLSDMVFIQCVGSRCAERDYCSRVCCSQTVKLSILLKERNPEMNITVMYRDIRTYGQREEYYRKARELGVVFARFDENEPPVVSQNGSGMTVTIKDQTMQRELEFSADMVSLAAAVVPREDTRALSHVLKVSRSQDGFFQEAHVKLRPIDFASEGEYMCGLAHSPMSMDEAVSQGLAAAARCGGVLGKDQLESDACVATVNEEMCAGCVTCVRMCPYGVPRMNMRGKAEISPLSCHGCGTCVAQCPAKAIELPGFTDTQICSMCDSAFTYDPKAPVGV